MNNAIPPSIPGANQLPAPIPPAVPAVNQKIPPKMRVCKKCGSTRIQAMAITKGKIKKRGCLSTLFHIFMTIITFGLWIIIPLLRGGSHGKITTKIEYICLDCGKKQ